LSKSYLKHFCELWKFIQKYGFKYINGIIMKFNIYNLVLFLMLLPIMLSAQIKKQADVFPAGGGHSENTQYKNFGTFGQPAASTSSNSSYINKEGFLNAQDSPVCTNPTAGGTIASAQTICYNTAPAAFTSSALPTGHTGDLEYQWQISIASPTFVDIPGAVSETYTHIGTVTQTTWFRRLARVTCDPVGWVSATSTNLIEVIVRPEFTSGEIATTGETICYNSSPAADIGNSAAAAGGDNTIAYSWRSSVDNYDVAIAGATLSTYTPAGPLTSTTSYRRYAKDNSCNTTPQVSSGTWTVTVRDEFTSGEIASTGETICYNSSPATAIGNTTNASGGDNTITYSWRSSVDSYTAAIDGATLSTYTPAGPLTSTNSSPATSYRRYAKDNTCNTTPQVSTGTWTVIVRPEFTSGEIASTGETICYNSSPATAIGNTTTASGGDNTITYSWKSSVDSYDLAIDGATLSTYTPAGPLTSTTSYRRYAKDNSCNTTPQVSTGTWTVTVDPISEGGSISGNASIIYGSSTGALNLSGYTGTILKWQRRFGTDGSWVDISNTNAVLSETPTSAGTWFYRAQVQSGVCNPDFSDLHQLVVTAKELAIGGSFTAFNKVYDGNTTASFNAKNLTLTGVVGTDDVSLTGEAIHFADPNVANNILVSIASANLAGVQATNYSLSLTGSPTTTANITTKELTIGSTFTANNKVYDGNTTSSFIANNLSLVGVVGTDDVTLSSEILNFADPNVANNSLVSITAASLAGAKAFNYSLSLVGSPTANANITAKELTVAGSFTANNKVYDGNTTASFIANNLTLTGVVGTDDVSLTGEAINFADPNVANGIAVSITAASLAGAKAFNYSLSLVGSPTSNANITTKELTVAGSFTAFNKVYDGNTTASFNAKSLTLIGVVGTDDVSLTGEAIHFADPNVANNILVSITSASLSGTKAFNYSLSLVGSPTSNANITTKELTVAGSFTANNKVYDGNTTASFNAKNLTLTGVVGTDDVSLTGEAIHFADPNVANNILVSITAASLAGTKAFNYSLSLVGSPTANANITTKELTVAGSFTAFNKVYNGNTTASFNANNLSLIRYCRH
jgi:hypothetical protein